MKTTAARTKKSPVKFTISLGPPPLRRGATEKERLTWAADRIEELMRGEKSTVETMKLVVRIVRQAAERA